MATAASLPVELEPLGPGSGPENSDAHWDSSLLPQLPPGADSVLGGATSAMNRSIYSSRLLTMRDGVRVAVDVLVPEDCGGGRPRDFVLVQARYGRAYRLRHPYKDALWGGKPVDVVYLNWKPLWLAAGLAIVTMDVRGCGASFGTWSGPWSEAELSDSLEVLAWAAAQPWAAGGKALLFGQSYDAGCALHTASCAPAGSVAGVVAVNPFLDMYQDISFPGGCFQHQFGTHWSGIIRAFDSQRLGAAPAESSMLALVARGVARALPEEELPAPGATLTWLQRRTARRRRQALLEAAISEHANNWAPLVDGPPHVAFMDDVAPTLGKSMAETNCAHLLPALAASGVPILWTSAWFDATVSSATAGFAATRHTPGTQLLVGPWTHMLWQHVVTSGRGSSRLTAFSVPKETLRWALQFVGRGGGASAPAGNDAAAQPPRSSAVNIYEMAAGRWLHLPDWPRTSSATWLLGPGRSLVAAGGVDTAVGRDELTVRLQDKPAGWSRWKGMLNVGKMVRYRRLRRLPLRYVGSTAQAVALRLCGSPVVTVFLDTSDGSGDVFAYLLDVDPAGKCHYIAEGCLRLQHRQVTADPAAMGPRLHSMLPQAAPSLPMRTFLRADACGPMPRPGEPPAQVTFALMPVSYVLARGHRLGLALTGSDDTHFDPLPGTSGRVLGVSYGGGTLSRVDLPVLE